MKIIKKEKDWKDIYFSKEYEEGKPEGRFKTYKLLDHVNLRMTMKKFKTLIQK